jgi:hypothetical protein
MHEVLKLITLSDFILEDGIFNNYNTPSRGNTNKYTNKFFDIVNFNCIL